MNRLSIMRDAYRALGPGVETGSSKLSQLIELATTFRTIRPRTTIGLVKIAALYRFLEQSAPLPGAMAEIGVYKGGTAKFIAMIVPTKKLYLFDTFEGMPGEKIVDDKAVDWHWGGDFNDTSRQAVERLMQGSPKVIFRQGFFPGTTEGLEEETFSFVHIDGDLYQSTLDALRYFYPRMTPGGIMVFDDYEWPRCPGVKLAIDEYLDDKPEKTFTSVPYQAVLIKE